MNNYEQVVVKKWWWENSAELSKSAQNVQKDVAKWLHQAIVVSAIRSENFNTTDKLIEIGKLMKQKSDIALVKEKLFEIQEFHFSVVDQNFRWEEIIIKEKIAQKFQELIDVIESWYTQNVVAFPSKENDYSLQIDWWSLSLIGFGENLSAYVQEEVLNSIKIKAKVVSLDDVIPLQSDKLDNSQLFLKLSQSISQKINQIFADGYIPIVPGYIPWFEKGIEKSIWRWYTDATAAIASVGLKNSWAKEVVLEIQKSVQWILSADPRIVKDGTAKLIQEIDYLTAKEITGTRGAQAKLLHPQVLRKELQEADIKVKLFDPFSNSPGTVISKSKNTLSSDVEFIGWRKNVTFFSISSGKMSEEWILASVFSVVKNYASVDIISTSETEISFTIDSWLSEQKLEEMVAKIRDVLDIQEDGYENFVKYQKNKALVFCVGQNLQQLNWIFAKAVTALSKWHINIDIISQWLMKRAIVFGVDAKDLHPSINLLHQELVAKN